MIFLLHGTDELKSRMKLNDLVKSLLIRKPDAGIIRLNNEAFNQKEFLDYMNSQGLFEAHLIMVLDSVLKNEEGEGIVLKSLKEMSESENIFIILENKLDKKTLIRISKHTEKVQEFNLKEKIKKESFNIFSLSDALGQRNKKRLWVIYQKGKSANISDEEMHGILFWSFKCMIVSKNAKNPNESGLNPFVFKKNLQFVNNYSEDELRSLSSNLVSLYHNARRGIKPLDIALEQFILAI